MPQYFRPRALWSLTLGLLLSQNTSVNLWKSQLVSEVEQIMSLGTLDKIPMPDDLTRDLVQYRQQWHSRNPKIAPFLGHWRQGWELFNSEYDLFIFPSVVPDQVCLLATEVPYQDPFEPPAASPLPSLSVLKLNPQEGQNQAWQLKRSLIHSLQYDSDQFQFFGILLGPNYDSMRIYAAAGPPQLPSGLPKTIQTEFTQHQCLSALTGPN